MILEVASESPITIEAKAALAELDQAKPLQPGRRKTSNVIMPTRVELPAVLNLNGRGEFARLELPVRSNSMDLADEQGSWLDEGLLERTFALPEDGLALPAERN